MSSKSVNNITSQQIGVSSSSNFSYSRNGDSKHGNKVRRKSYADWITRAIQSTEESKLTLAGIYNWMASNVPGLYEKRNLHSSKGWKNAVRHTLSVNRRFEKISQPNVRAALWSLVPQTTTDSESSIEILEQSEDTPKLELPSCSTLFPDGTVTMTTVATVSSLTIPLSSSHIFSSSTSTTTFDPDPIVTHTQRLELHHQNGTVRTVTVPVPYPIHVVGDYRLVTVDKKPGVMITR